jgi:hypothetical protein
MKRAFFYGATQRNSRRKLWFSGGIFTTEAVCEHPTPGAKPYFFRSLRIVFAARLFGLDQHIEDFALGVDDSPKDSPRGKMVWGLEVAFAQGCCNRQPDMIHPKPDCLSGAWPASLGQNRAQRPSKRLNSIRPPQLAREI